MVMEGSHLTDEFDENSKYPTPSEAITATTDEAVTNIGDISNESTRSSAQESAADSWSTNVNNGASVAIGCIAVVKK